MAELLLDPGVVYFKDPFKPGSHAHRWWADRGRIHFEDCVTGAYSSISVRDCLVRLKGINDMMGTRGDPGVAQFADERQKYSDYIDAMVGLCEKARRQGVPENPAHAKQKADDIKAARQSKNLYMPAAF